MITRESVLEDLQQTAARLQYRDLDNVTQSECEEAVFNAIDFLNAQEPVEPETLTVLDFGTMETAVHLCGACRMPIERGDKYCRHCGKEIRWHG